MTVKKISFNKIRNIDCIQLPCIKENYLLQLKNIVDERIHITKSVSLNLKIYPGEAVALIGKNGCGKTSLMRIVVGILEPTEGDVFLSDDYAYLPHKNGLYDHLKVFDYIKGHKKFPENKYIGNLSSGQKRSIAIQKLKEQNKILWIIDEPTTHLDEGSVFSFYDEIKKHCESGGSVFISSHDNLPAFFRKISL